MDLFTTLGRSDRAVEVGLDYLRRVGIDWSAHPTRGGRAEANTQRIWRAAREPPDRSAARPAPDDRPGARARQWTSSPSLVSPALFTDENLLALVIGRMGNLSLEHGNSDGIVLRLCGGGHCAGAHFGDYKAGFRFGQLGLTWSNNAGWIA